MRPLLALLAALLLGLLAATAGATPPLAEEELLVFLREAPVVASKELTGGSTRPLKLTLERDGVRLHAVFRTVDRRFQDPWQAGRTTRRQAVRDSYRYEVAAYELDRLLGLGRVPPTVRRTIDGVDGSVQLWVEDAATEADRLRAGRLPARPARHFHQRQLMHLFDNLTLNLDRNHGNMLLDAGERLWLIDHTRAFQPYPSLLPDHDRELLVIDPAVWRRVRELDPALLAERLGPHLDAVELDALLRRRQRLAAYVDRLVASRGADAVFVGP